MHYHVCKNLQIVKLIQLISSKESASLVVLGLTTADESCKIGCVTDCSSIGSSDRLGDHFWNADSETYHSLSQLREWLVMEHTCLFCNHTFDSIRPNVKYCCSAHRLYAYREREGIVTKKEKKFTHCQRPGCENEIPDSRQANAHYCSNACNQAVYNKTHAQELSAKRLAVRVARKKAKEKAEKRKQIKQAEKQSKDLADDFLKELLENG